MHVILSETKNLDINFRFFVVPPQNDIYLVSFSYGTFFEHIMLRWFNPSVERCPYVCFFCTFAHVSRSDTVRLNTSASSEESTESTQK